MEIIKCAPKHLDVTSAFYDKITKYLEEHVNYPRWTHGDYPSRQSAKQAISEGTQYICEDNGAVVGAFVLNDNPQGDYSAGDWKKTLNSGEFMVIHGLASDYEIQRRGIARKMVEFCIEEARRRGYGALRLDVVPDNIPARRLYESMGFSFAGERNVRPELTEIPLFALYELNF